VVGAPGWELTSTRPPRERGMPAAVAGAASAAAGDTEIMASPDPLGTVELGPTSEASVTSPTGRVAVPKLRLSLLPSSSASPRGGASGVDGAGESSSGGGSTALAATTQAEVAVFSGGGDGGGREQGLKKHEARCSRCGKDVSPDVEAVEWHLEQECMAPPRLGTVPAGTLLASSPGDVGALRGENLDADADGDDDGDDDDGDGDLEEEQEVVGAPLEWSPREREATHRGDLRGSVPRYPLGSTILSASPFESGRGRPLWSSILSAPSFESWRGRESDSEKEE